MGSLRDRGIACSASDHQGTNLKFCVWRAVSSHSSHHPKEVFLARFSLYVHKLGLSPIHFTAEPNPRLQPRSLTGEKISSNSPLKLYTRACSVISPPPHADHGAWGLLMLLTSRGLPSRDNRSIGMAACVVDAFRLFCYSIRLGVFFTVINLSALRLISGFN